MSPSATFLVTGSLLWMLVIHFSLSRLHHWFFRVMSVLALGGFFYLMSQHRPEEISPHILWVTPLVGLIIVLWGMVVRLDRRAVISLLIGALVIGLAVWATTAQAQPDSTNQLPSKQELTAPVPTEPPGISRVFLYEMYHGENQ